MTDTGPVDASLLDEILGGLGTPPAGLPTAGVGAILGRAALLATPGAAVATGLLGWKLWGVLGAVAILAFGGGWVSRDLGHESVPPSIELAWMPHTHRPAHLPEVIALETAARPTAPAAVAAASVSSMPDHPVSVRTVSRDRPAPPATSSDACPEPLAASARWDEPIIAGEVAPFLDEDLPDSDEDVPARIAREADELAIDLPPLHEPHVDASAGYHAAPVADRARAALLVGVGAAGGMSAWAERAPPAGPSVRLDVAWVGPGDRPLRPLFRMGGEATLLAGDDERESRFVGGGQVAGGFVLGRAPVRFELAWAGGVRVMTPGSDMEGLYDEEAGWVYALTGPELALTFGGPGVIAFRVGASAQGALLDLEGDGIVRLIPWIGLTLGADIPLPGRRR